MVNRRNNIVLVRRDVSKRITLPNGRTFMAKYRRVNRHHLPGRITIARTYRGQPARARRPPAVRAPAAAGRKLPAWLQAYNRKGRCRGRRQGGKGLGDIVKTVANNPYAQEIGKRLVTKGINYIPTLFKKGTKKTKQKNKHLRKMAQSDIVEDLVNEGTRRLHGGIGL